MFKPTSILEGKTIDAPEADFRAAKRVEQYRISDKALYIPAGLKWTYLPLSAVESVEESHRCVVRANASPSRRSGRALPSAPEERISASISKSPRA